MARVGLAEPNPQTAKAANAAPDELTRLRRELAEYRAWVGAAAAVCERAARGDLEARVLRIDCGGELAQMLHSINHLLDLTDAFVREARASLEYASHGKYWRRVLLRGMLGTFCHGSQLINQATEEMERQAMALAESSAERLRLAGEFEGSIQQVVAVVAASATEARATAESLSSIAATTRIQAESVAAASEQTSACVQTVASATEEMTASVSEVERQTRESVAMAHSAVTEAGSSQAVMGKLSEASQRIGSVVKLITTIARQTNLLALNATIEAVRAGEAGRGFLVVASEVKALAQQTAQATDEITEEVQTIQSMAAQGLQAISSVGKTIQSMNEISTAIAETMRQERLATDEISHNIQQAAIGSKEVARSVIAVTSAAQETSTSAGQLLDAANDLSRQAETLRVAVDEFLTNIRGQNRAQ